MAALLMGIDLNFFCLFLFPEQKPYHKWRGTFQAYCYINLNQPELNMATAYEHTATFLK